MIFTYYKTNVGRAQLKLAYFVQIRDICKHMYFIPQAPTSALTSSRKDVKQLVYFQILQTADNIFFYSVIILL